MKNWLNIEKTRNNLHSIIISGVILSFVWTSISYGWSGLIASPWDIITATKWNEMINKIYPIYGTGWASGNVWIGDTSPDHKFDVAGNIGLNSSSYINFWDVDGSTWYGFRDNAGILQFKNSAGSWANIPSAISGGDNLWNHTATQNISLDTFWLSGDGDSEGISINTNGDITLAPWRYLNFQNPWIWVVWGGFNFWLTNDFASLYAVENSADNSDYVFKFWDNATDGGDRFVFWQTWWQGITNDRWPLIMNGLYAAFNPHFSTNTMAGTMTSATAYMDYNTEKVWIGIISPNTKLDVNGDLALRFGTNYSTTWTANDVSFSGGTTSNVRYTWTATATVTWIAWWYDGKLLYIHNTSSYILTLANQSASSTTTNRIITWTDADIALAPDESAALIYDATTTRWRVINSTPKRYTYRMTAAQASTSTTMANVTQLTSWILPVWAYEIRVRGKFRTVATTTGIWLTLKAQTAAISDIWIIYQAQSTATANQQYSITANWTSVTTTATPVANTDYALMMNGTFNVTTAGTVAIQMKSEVAASAATLWTWTFLTIEPLY